MIPRRSARLFGAALGPAAALVACLATATALGAQQRGTTLRLVGPDGEARTVELGNHRGYLAVAASALEPLGWAATRDEDGWDLRHGRGLVVALRRDSPFFRWDGRLLQLTAEPYDLGGELHLPLQLLLDFFPARLPDVYAVEESGRVLRVKDPSHWPAPRPSSVRAEPDLGDAVSASPTEPSPPPVAAAGSAPPGGETPRADPGRRIVIIDPGHGGRDPGATGPGGTREKDVALGVALALGRELEQYPHLEVHLTRSSDVLVPIWQRGEWATSVRGDRPGVFISIHANALPSQRAARGFETYFLSDARTEHERRVAANENAPLSIEAGDVADGSDPDLTFILKELRNLDHTHWSALLAELIQGRMAPVHPGPNRGVKQAPLAVITNTLMPAVLVETGFITNRDEERLLARGSFQEDLARALAGAVLDFFERYPPGQGAGAGAGRVDGMEGTGGDADPETSAPAPG